MSDHGFEEPEGFDLPGFPRPFTEPRFVVAQLRFEAQADAIDFTDLCSAPRSGIERDEQTVRPAVVLWKVHERQLFGLAVG